MKPFLPPRFAPIAAGFLLSAFMTFIVSAISTINALGLENSIIKPWMQAWFASWLVAFPVVLFVAPFVRWIVSRITIQP